MMLSDVEVNEQLNEHIIIFWFTLIVGIVTFSIAWFKGFFKSFKVVYLPYVKGYEVLAAFFIFLFTEAILVPLFATGAYYLTTGENLLGYKLGTLQVAWLNAATILAGFVSIIVVYYMIPRERRDAIIQQTPGAFLSNVRVGIIGWFISFPLVMAFSQVIAIIVLLIFKQSMVDQTAVRHMKALMDHPVLFSFTTLELITIVPFTEEFLFRGLLQSWIKRRCGRATVAIVVSSFIFALFHFSFSQGVTNIELISALFMLSCFLGYLYEQQRSLWANVSLHGFFNLVSVVFIFKDNLIK